MKGREKGSGSEFSSTESERHNTGKHINSIRSKTVAFLKPKRVINANVMLIKAVFMICDDERPHQIRFFDIQSMVIKAGNAQKCVFSWLVIPAK